MRRAAGWGELALTLALALALVIGVGSAAGRSAAITTITVEVIGQGRVTSDPGGIKCGGDGSTCYAAFSGSGSVDLKASPAGGWNFDSWGAPYDTDACGGGSHCLIPIDGADHVVTANFAGPSTGTSTLTVTYEGQGTVHGGDILCGAVDDGTNTGVTVTENDCVWSVLTGSTLTVHETPDQVADPGFVFAGWGGACDDTDDACTIKLDSNKTLSATWTESSDLFPLSVSISGNGRVEGGGIICRGPATCVENESANRQVTLTATPDKGFSFSAWTGACAGSGPTCTVTMTEERSVAATFAPSLVQLHVTVVGNGNVSGSLGLINCGLGANVCDASVTPGPTQTVTLIATPAIGATFTGWTGACGGTASTCTVLMNQSKSVTATFSGGTAGGTGFLLSVSVTGSGTVTGSGITCGSGATTCSTTPTPNSTVTLTATPATGSTFSGWGGSCFGASTTCTVLMSSAKSVTASFTPSGGSAQQFLLAVAVSGSGTVSGGGITCGAGGTTCSANLPEGTTVTLVATPSAGASFRTWSGGCSGSAPTCTVTMTVAQNVSATFSAPAPGTLTLTVKGNGTVSAPNGRCVGTGATRTCVQKYTAGRTVTLTATPAAGSTFAGWSDACLAQAKKRTCTLKLSIARSATATFLTSTGGGGGGGGGTAGGVLRSLGAPIVRRSTTGFRVTLRFSTTQAGLARVRGLRAGRVAASVSVRVGAGPATIGPFPVRLAGFYVFEVHLAGRTLRFPTCLGSCGRAAPGPNFVLIREAPRVTRSGDVWSVTLRFRENLISSAHVRAVRAGKALVDQHFLGRTGEILVGPFLLGPGNYTLRVTATDAYGRTRTLSWVVALAR